MNSPHQPIQLYISGEHPCSYLAETEARTLFVDPDLEMENRVYAALIDQGFRRSGGMVYQPRCIGCEACRSIRVPVKQFRPNRSQRRIWNRLHQQVEVVQRPFRYDDDHYRLFKRYLGHRHNGGEMNQTSQQGYIDFLSSPWSETDTVEFRYEGELFAVTVVDRLPQGLSAVYTFFEPRFEALSPGVFTIFWQIEACRSKELAWLYLGYWIGQCQKMSYKINFRPCQQFHLGLWHAIGRGDNPG